MKLVDEVELEKGEDAPMSMAGHPDVCISVHARENILNLIYRALQYSRVLTALRRSCRKARTTI